MSRHTFRTAVLVALVGLADADRPHGLRAAEPAPPPRPKVPTVVVRSVKPGDDSATASRGFVTTYGLTDRDLDRFRKIPDITAVVPVRHIPAEVRHLGRLLNGRVVATVPDFAEVNVLKPSAGRFLTQKDDTDREDVCVLGSEAAAKLFPVGSPLGESVAIRSHFFKIVGVLGETGGDADRDVYVPLATSRARFGSVLFIRKAGTRTAEKVDLHEIIVRVGDPDERNAVANIVREALKKDHPKKDWEVGSR